MQTFRIEELRNRVATTEAGCWVWEGAKDSNGQGVLRVGSGQQKARRTFWASCVGPIPDGYQLRSKNVPGCVGKLCCNPAHLKLMAPLRQGGYTTCQRGHPLTPDNQEIENRNGKLITRCRKCRHDRRQREAWQRAVSMGASVMPKQTIAPQ